MYTNEQLEILSRYPQLTVAEISSQTGKSERSIVGKLSRMGIYQRKVYLSKNGENPITKLEIVSRLSNKLGIDLEGLEKAPKSTLQRLEKVVGGTTDDI